MPPGKKKVTIQDIADALGISPSAVSKALNDHPRISDRTKKAVRETALMLNYQRNTLASGLRSGKSHLVGVIVPAIDYTFFSSVLRGIEEAGTEAGYNIIISQSGDSTQKEQECINALVKTQVDGVIASIANSTTTFGHFQKLIDEGIPLILFDRTSEELEVSSVVIDDFAGAMGAVEHLIDQGCKRIVHLAGYRRINLYQRRINGYSEALAKNGLPFSEGSIRESDLSMDDGHRIMDGILREGPPPDGVFAASDHAALGALHALQEAGLRVPEDVAVIGFSNEPFTAFIRPSLSTVDQQSVSMGRLAARLFLDQLKADKAAARPCKMVLQPELIIRQSSLRKAALEKSGLDNHRQG